MKVKTKEDHEIALFRYQLIVPLLNKTYPDSSALQYCKRITQKPLPYINDTFKQFSHQSIKYWCDLYRKHGFDGLYPKTRSDAGQTRRLDEHIKELIRAMRQANPRLTATNIYLQLIHDGHIRKCDMSLSTVTRFISRLPKQHLPKEDMRAFEMQCPNDLWQLDTTYASYLTLDHKKQRTYLIMAVDDCSRLIVGFGFFLEDNAINVQTVLKQAISKYGIPKRIYTDHGGSYKNSQLALICAHLQIEIARAQVYHGNQKGKVERAFRSVKEQWMYQQDFSAFRSLEELNQAFSSYVKTKNTTIHRSLNGSTPLNSFMEKSNQITLRRIDPESLTRAFYHTATRTVANDACVRLNNRIYETAQEYIATRVTLKYTPNLEHVFLVTDGSYKEIFEVNKVDNSKIKRNEPLYRGYGND